MKEVTQQQKTNFQTLMNSQKCNGSTVCRAKKLLGYWGPRGASRAGQQPYWVEEGWERGEGHNERASIHRRLARVLPSAEGVCRVTAGKVAQQEVSVNVIDKKKRGRTKKMRLFPTEGKTQSLWTSMASEAWGFRVFSFLESRFGIWGETQRLILYKAIKIQSFYPAW